MSFSNIKNTFQSKTSLLNEIFLLASFAVLLMSGTVSNYTIASFIIKCTVLVLVLILILLKEKSYNENIWKRIRSYDISKLIKIILLFIIVPSVSLFYSENPQFGSLKILNLILSSLLPTLILFYLLIDWTENRFRILIEIVLSTALISVIAILAAKPFYYDQVYDLMTFHWSHVFFGRFLGLAFLASMIFTINQTTSRGKILLIIITLFIGFGLIVTGLRSAITGVLISSLLLLISGMIKKQMNYSAILSVISILIFGVILFFIAGAIQGNIKTRVDKLVETFQLKDSGDEAIETRIEGYKVSLKRISDSPLIGSGFGGYKSDYKGNKIGEIISYPHNIFLEAFVEMGAAGLLLIIFIIIVILKKSFDISYQLFAIIIFSVWLAQFSKDIPTQTTLWAGLAFIIRSKI